MSGNTLLYIAIGGTLLFMAGALRIDEDARKVFSITDSATSGLGQVIGAIENSKIVENFGSSPVVYAPGGSIDLKSLRAQKDPVSNTVSFERSLKALDEIYDAGDKLYRLWGIDQFMKEEELPKRSREFMEQRRKDGRSLPANLEQKIILERPKYVAT